jgi:hypothetical protein
MIIFFIQLNILDNISFFRDYIQFYNILHQNLLWDFYNFLYNDPLSHNLDMFFHYQKILNDYYWYN